MSVTKSVTKSKNNMGGAYGNQKKIIEELKTQNIVLKENQNGIRLKLNETGDFTNIVSLTNDFRLPGAKSVVEEPSSTPTTYICQTKDIKVEKERIQLTVEEILNNEPDDDDEDEERELRALRAKIVEFEKKHALKKAQKRISELRKTRLDLIDAEIAQEERNFELLRQEHTNRRAEIVAKMSKVENGEYDAELMNEIVAQMTVQVITTVAPQKTALKVEKEKRERNTVKRKELTEVICGKPRSFKIVIDKKEFRCNGNGKEFSDGKRTFKSLNNFVEVCVKSLNANGQNGRKISAYNQTCGVQILHLNGVWEFLGACYNEDTEFIN